MSRHTALLFTFFAAAICFKSPLVSSDTKTGICPDVSTDGEGFVPVCEEPCLSDSDCSGRQKCCLYSCGNTCREPHPQPDSSELSCADITIPECLNVLPYNTTRNLQDQGVVRDRLLNILGSNQSCSHDIIFAACAWHLPLCPSALSDPIALPCRSLCLRLKNTCKETAFVLSLTNGVGCGTMPNIPTSEHHNLCDSFSQPTQTTESESSSSVILLSSSESTVAPAPSTALLSLQDTMLSSSETDSITVNPTLAMTASSVVTTATDRMQDIPGASPTAAVPASSAGLAAASSEIGTLLSVSPSPRNIPQTLRSDSEFTAFAADTLSLFPSPSAASPPSRHQLSSSVSAEASSLLELHPLAGSSAPVPSPSARKTSSAAADVISPSLSLKPGEVTPSPTLAILRSASVERPASSRTASVNPMQSSSTEVLPTSASSPTTSVSINFPPPPPPIPPFSLRLLPSSSPASHISPSPSTPASVHASSEVQSQGTGSQAIQPTPSSTPSMPPSASSTDKDLFVTFSTESMVSLHLTATPQPSEILQTSLASHHDAASSVALVTPSESTASPQLSLEPHVSKLPQSGLPSLGSASSGGVTSIMPSESTAVPQHVTPTPQISASNPPLSSQPPMSSSPPTSSPSSSSLSSSQPTTPSPSSLPSVVMETASTIISPPFTQTPQLPQLPQTSSVSYDAGSSVVMSAQPSSSSPLPYSSSSPTPHLVNATEIPVTMANHTDTVPPTEAAPVKQKYKMILDGDCAIAMESQQNFSVQFVKQIAKTLKADEDKFVVEKVSCGSTVVEFTADTSASPNMSAELQGMVNDGSFVFFYSGQNFTMVDLVIVPASPEQTATDAAPTTPKAKSTKGLSYDQQQFIIYVLLATACGIGIIIAIAFCIQKYSRQCCRTRKRTFELASEEQFVKLSDFNMAHTTIPRPKSIYEQNLDSNGKFKPYTNEEETQTDAAGDANSVEDGQSCSVFTQTEGSQEAVKHPQVSGSGQLSPDTRASQEFAKSSVPAWNLPKLEGVVRQGDDTEQLKRLNRPSSDTFREPVTTSSTPSHPPSIPPPVPPPPPPPPPPAFMDPPTSSKPGHTAGSVRNSDTFSETSDASTVTDTRHLLQSRDGSPSSAGVDNPALIPDVSYVPKM